MVRCQEMSQITPTIALVAASTTATTYHGRPTAPALARPVETAAVLISYRSPEPPATSPLPRHFSKIFFACSCASSSACLGLIRPVAALANMVGRTNVSKISLSAGFAGPGCPMFVAHCRAVPIGLSFDGGEEPNGSVAVDASSHWFPASGRCATGTPGSATEPGNEGKL